MATREELARAHSIIHIMRLVSPAIIAVVLTLVLYMVFEQPLWLAALVGISLAIAELIAFSIIMNRLETMKTNT